MVAVFKWRSIPTAVAEFIFKISAHVRVYVHSSLSLTSTTDMVFSLLNLVLLATIAGIVRRLLHVVSHTSWHANNTSGFPCISSARWAPTPSFPRIHVCFQCFSLLLCVYGHTCSNLLTDRFDDRRKRILTWAIFIHCAVSTLTVASTCAIPRPNSWKSVKMVHELLDSKRHETY